MMRTPHRRLLVAALLASGASCTQTMTLQLPAGSGENPLADDASSEAPKTPATPELLGILPNIVSLAAASGRLYATSRDGSFAIWEAELGLRVVDRYQTGAFGLTVDDERIYIGVAASDEQGGPKGSIVTYRRENPVAPPEVFSQAQLPLSIVSDKSSVFVSDNTLVQIDRSTRQRTVLASCGLGALAKSGQGVVCGDYFAGELKYLSLPSGTARLLYKGPTRTVFSVATLGERIFFLVGSGNRVQVFSITDASEEPNWLASLTQAGYALAVNASHIYFTTRAGGDLYRLPLSGGDPELLSVSFVSSSEGSGAIALDDSYVYWGTSQGELLRLRIK